MLSRSCTVIACLVALVLCCGVGEAAGRWRNSLAPKGTKARPLTLAKNGQTEYVIVLPSSPTTQERKAAEELAHWLGEMTRATFEIIPDSRPARDTEVSIGRTKRLRLAQSPPLLTGLGNEGYAIAVDGRRLFLLGGKTRGPINAVYALLEEDLGCRWYDRTSSRIPRQPTLRVRVVPRRFVPQLMIRDPFYFDAFDPTWSLRNRTNAPMAPVPEEWGGHVDYGDLFVHTFDILVPAAQYFEKHPDYYMLHDGKRTPRQLCLTNADVVAIATERALRFLREHPYAEIVEVSPNDGGGHCSCPNCAKVDAENGGPSGSLIEFVNQIAEAVEKERPGAMVSTLAYLDTVDPPKKLRPRRNVTVRLCNDLHAWRYPFTCFATDTKPESARYRDALIGWSKICNNVTIWDYFINFSHYPAPIPNMDILAPSVDFYMRHHVTGIMMQAECQGFGAEFAPLRAWVMAKLLWDPSRNVNQLVDEFIHGYYETAAQDIQAYWSLLYATKAKRLAEIATPPYGIRYPMDIPLFSKEFLAEANRLLTHAAAQCQREELLHRVQLAKVPILYVQLMQGPDVWSTDYGALINEFETIARRESILFLYEGPASLDEKLQGWRTALQMREKAAHTP